MTPVELSALTVKIDELPAVTAVGLAVMTTVGTCITATVAVAELVP